MIFSWFVVEVEAGRNNNMRCETHIFNIEMRKVNRSFPIFFSHEQYIFSIDWEYIYHNIRAFCGFLAHRDISRTEFKSRHVYYFGKFDQQRKRTLAWQVPTFVWHGGETLGTFWMGLIVTSSSPFIEKIRFSGSHEAYLLNSACHQYNFCSKCSVI